MRAEPALGMALGLALLAHKPATGGGKSSTILTQTQ
jgi:hypothetical protein